MTLGLLPKLRTLWLHTSQVLCYDQIEKEVYDSAGQLVLVHPYTTTPNKYGDHLVSKNSDEHLQTLASLWASESSSLSTIYVNIGYDEHWGMTSPFRIGSFDRISKMPDGSWYIIDLDHWSEDGRGLHAKHYIPADGQRGILEHDIDFFADQNIYC